MTAPINIYYIWYGNWAGNTATTILTDFARNIGGSSYFNINTTYYDLNGARVSNSVNFGGATTDNYSRGLRLTDGDVRGIVEDAITGGRLPQDPDNGVYFVLASSDVSQGDFCTENCGWHNHNQLWLFGPQFNISFIGNGDRCPDACQQQLISPNYNAAADGMANVIAHELEEMATDPHINAWYDDHNDENGDKCAWTYGSTYLASNGSLANMRLGNRNYLIQRNLLNDVAQTCVSGFSSWSALPGYGHTDAAISATQFGSKLYVFMKGIVDHRIYVQSYDGSSWSGWAPVPGTMFTNVALGSANFRSHLYVFAKGDVDNRMYFNTYNGSSWGGWREVPGAGHTDVALGATVFGGQMFLFAKGIGNNQIWMMTYDGSSWNGWREVPGGGTTDTALSATTFSNKLYLVAKGIVDHNIYVNAFDGSAWSGWGQMAGTGTTDVAVAVTQYRSDLYVFNKGINDRQIFLTYQRL